MNQTFAPARILSPDGVEMVANAAGRTACVSAIAIPIRRETSMGPRNLDVDNCLAGHRFAISQCWLAICRGRLRGHRRSGGRPGA